MNFLSRLRRDEGGLATVEAAIALPWLFLVFFFFVGGSLLFTARHQLDRASRESARAAAISNKTNDQLKTIADETLTFTDPDSESVTRCKTATSPVMITVTVAGTLLPELAVPFFDIINPTLSASTSIVPEWDPSSLPTDPSDSQYVPTCS